MIKIDFANAIAIFLFISLFLVIGRWVFYTYRRQEDPLGKSEYLQKCPYCTHLFFNYLTQELVICPKCKSYIVIEKLNGPEK